MANSEKQQLLAKFRHAGPASASVPLIGRLMYGVRISKMVLAFIVTHEQLLAVEVLAKCVIGVLANTLICSSS